MFDTDIFPVFDQFYVDALLTPSVTHNSVRDVAVDLQCRY